MLLRILDDRAIELINTWGIALFYASIFAFFIITVIVTKHTSSRFLSGIAKHSMIWEIEYLICIYSILLLFFPKKRRAYKQELWLMLALTSFALENYSCFLKFMNKLKDLQPYQSLWMAIYHLSVQHDVPVAEKYIADLGESFKEIGLLQAIYLFEKGETEEGVALMKEAAPTFRLAASKKLAKEYLAKYGSQEEQA